MNSRTYDEKLKNILTWVEITNHYWNLYRSDINNKTDFWDNTLHAMTERDWWDWVEIEPALRAQHPNSFRAYPWIKDGTEHINKSLMYGKPLVKPMRPSANFNTFRAWMNIKDVVNDLVGEPTKQYPKPEEIKPEDTPKNNWQDLFGTGE